MVAGLHEAIHGDLDLCLCISNDDTRRSSCYKV
jgi:hypothetical protein